ncbi:MAG TPA: 30S ribosomal protein S11 [Bdellovibrionales bacterium]|nr:30S ribosomal protein S11 [Bdellovibrionales bacterium]
MADAKSAAGGAEKSAPKKKIKRNVPIGRCFIQAGFGNTIVTFTDLNGNTIAWSSAGMLGFKGSRKGTPFAAQVAAEDAGKKAMEAGVKTIDVVIRGPGAGREPSVRALASMGLRVTSLKDLTPIPHNGCRPPKRRRI